MQESITIQKSPVLTDSSNYELLRKKGLEYIEQLGSAIWTDYNIHDPGITLLEALSYAITDLGYRTSLDLKDLLAEPPSKNPKDDPKRQGFFTAREILTVNPWTNADFRKLLVDINGIKNGWLTCKQCACNDLLIYAKCSTSKLQYQPTEHPIVIKGFYDVLVEFENDPASGDLNSGKVKYNFSFAIAGGYSTAMIEMRLPSWRDLQGSTMVPESFHHKKAIIDTVTVKFISGNKNDNTDMPAEATARLLRRPVFATVEVSFKPDKDQPATETILFSDIPMSIWFHNDNDRKQIKLPDIKHAISDASASGIFGKYVSLIHTADEVMATTATSLHAHRNLSEDYCSISAIKVEDIGICADIEADPAFDIEAILAEIYYQVDQYLSPDIKFYSLKELMDAGIAVDEIFEGPALNNGFINNDQLDATQLKTFVYTSDIINIIMDIPGVKAVRNFMLTKYDDEGNQVANEEWAMEVGFQRQPRLYLEACKILVYKNGLPFLPDMFELSDTLQTIKGKYAQPQYSILENNLPVPTGQYFDLKDYYPVTYSLPLTYGVSYDGLPDTASAERKAQAKQLKAYLLFYEQLLVNYLEQLSHVSDLFAIDDGVSETYFGRLIQNKEIRGIEELLVGINEETLQELLEPEKLFYERRNRFLDQLMARFAENFNEYALMLYSFSSGKANPGSKLVHDKIKFLQDFPFMSANRGRAFNYKDAGLVCSNKNLAGLQVRIQRLLGLDAFDNAFEIVEEKNTVTKKYERFWQLIDNNGKVQLKGITDFAGLSQEKTAASARQEIALVRQHIAITGDYDIKKEGSKWILNLTDGSTAVIANRSEKFNTKAAAEAARDEIIAFAASLTLAEKVFVVEHLLLRPRNLPALPDFPDGDPLLTICIPDNCELCGEEDPYSFRLTVVLSGETGIANSGIEFRRFAERIIRQEIPAHLAVKICWVSNLQLEEFEKAWCDWLSELAKQTPDAKALHIKLNILLGIFEQLKSVYPEARLHDCVDGDDSNRVFLDNTII